MLDLSLKITKNSLSTVPTHAFGVCCYSAPKGADSEAAETFTIGGLDRQTYTKADNQYLVVKEVWVLEKADGAAGARWAFSLVGIAACAETTHATLDADSAKVDMMLSFRHAFHSNSLLTVHAQVKSGSSYRAKSSTPQSITLNIDRDTLIALSRSSNLGMIIWVPPKPQDRLYWCAQDPRKHLNSPLRISRYQYVRPSIRYDLTRICVYSNYSKSVSMQTVRKADLSQAMARARKFYKELKSQSWSHPLVGNVVVTRMGWRHITKRSRAEKRRTLALRVIPYLKIFLATAPDRYVCNFSDIAELGSRVVETRYILCWYRSALSIDGKGYSLLLRIKEEITYPKKWRNQPLATRDISQTATLASWWCKEVR